MANLYTTSAAQWSSHLEASGLIYCRCKQCSQNFFDFAACQNPSLWYVLYWVGKQTNWVWKSTWIKWAGKTQSRSTGQLGYKHIHYDYGRGVTSGRCCTASFASWLLVPRSLLSHGRVDYATVSVRWSQPSGGTSLANLLQFSSIVEHWIL